MQDRASFLAEYHFTEEQFNKSGLNWDDLVEIEKDYLTLNEQLLPAAEHITKILRLSNKVHSLRFRLKKPGSLIAKIIRKKIDEPSRVIDLETYKSEITDLIGVRVIHLFKADWYEIHNFILENFDIIPGEIVHYFRKGDDRPNEDDLSKVGCRSEEHGRGYRSVHYLINPPTCKQICKAEIQVRTIYEEAWGEIDHTTSYPNASKHPLLMNSVDQLNRLSSACDNLATFISNLEKDFEEKEVERVKMISEMKSLQERVSKLGIESKEKQKIINELKNIEKSSIFIHGTLIGGTKNNFISVNANGLSSVHNIGLIPNVVNSTIKPSGTIFAGGSIGSESILSFKSTK